MERSPTLLLIRGLGHSGTTILDLALGAHPRIVGLGEATRILQTPRPGEENRGPALLRGSHRHERRCTCGELAVDCPVWGPALTWLVAHEQQPLHQKMQQLLNLVTAGVERGQLPDVIVDSFQDDLELPHRMPPNVDVRVIHLVRDVRSWLHSRLRATRQRKRWLPDLRTLARWWYVNRKFDRVLRQCGRPVFHLGYEELALKPERSLQLICDWLGLDFHDQMLTPGMTTKSHILSGNRMRFDKDRVSEIRYDSSWLDSSDHVIRLAMLIPPVQRLNQRLVYSNRILTR